MIDKTDRNLLFKGIQNRKDWYQKFVIVGILAVVILTLSLLTDDFLTLTNLSNVMRQVAMVIIAGSAVTILMISGNFDLSIGSVLALTGVMSAKFASMGVPVWTSIIVAIAIGCLVGTINGVLVVKLKIPSIIATLGMLYVARGLAFILIGGQTVILGIPKSFEFLGRGFIGPIPFPIFVFTIVVAIFYFIESKTILGRYSFAIGGNRITALLSGINVGAVTILLYVLVGACTGLSGALMASRLGVGQPNVGIGFEFDVIVAVLLGGTSLYGGEGSVSGMVIGALILGFLSNGLNLLGIHTFYQNVLKGLVLVGAVLLDRYLKTKIK